MLERGLLLGSAVREGVVDEGDEPPGAAGLPELPPPSVGVEAEGGDARPERAPPPRERVGAHGVPRVGQHLEGAPEQVIVELADQAAAAAG